MPVGCGCLQPSSQKQNTFENDKKNNHKTHGDPQGARTLYCGLEEVPSGEWFCSTCQTRREAEARRREADVRRDAFLQRAWRQARGLKENREAETRRRGQSRRRGRVAPPSGLKVGGEERLVRLLRLLEGLAVWAVVGRGRGRERRRRRQAKEGGGGGGGDVESGIYEDRRGYLG